MECPMCKLENHPEASKCDCGYDFNSGKIGKSLLPISPIYEKLKSWEYYILLLGWIGIIYFFTSIYPKRRGQPTRYKQAKIIIIIWIIITIILCVGIIVRGNP